eukprot:gene27856-49578_t
MQTMTIDVRTLARTAVDKLRGGDARGARALYEQVVAAGVADAAVFHSLAQACGMLQDHAAALAAIDRALALTPSNVFSLVLKADLLAARGDGRGATAFYQAALKAA